MTHIPQVSPIRLNLGSGANGIDGWINVDADPKLRMRWALPLLRLMRKLGVMSAGTLAMYEGVQAPPNLLAWNFGRKPLPFADGTVDAVFTSHTLEHFPRWQAEQVAREAFRVLRPGGILRVTVPDLEVIARRYLISKGGALDLLAPEQREPMSAREVNMIFYTKDHVQKGSRLDSVDFRLAGIAPHMYIFDTADMSDLLHRAGFQDVEKCSFRVGKCPDVGKLDNRPAETLYLEGHKPANVDGRDRG
ncbi:MAG: class I SAM-dependent methyltransferase [Euryarchaeota archaeon]|nr:class I SAM-dependent methyltransferase [Euryarchaeota archaeon]MDE2046276.1 class I SAM-dependent methyltransferase [Thermoplasmata archaeon]